LRTFISSSLLYPGDDVVDWNGISIFNNDVCLPVGPTTNCDGSTIDPYVQKDLDWKPKKKMICESAVQPPSSGTSDGFINYLTLVKALVEENGVSAWTYINRDWTTTAGQPTRGATRASRPIRTFSRGGTRTLPMDHTPLVKWPYMLLVFSYASL
jgi:hypothetical protein